ncbi:glyoxalase family protein [Palleronia marisminoris]|uniref:Putative ring-cleaving dioxygenase MhqO n=1 Tax=Palleronia marisminoris TaxID=315423 RepID=A0A1Y5TQF9_9RHOB|nr:ring-cleaving dioxygenase [Palleronia marisminoris]SFH48649.1 glyoxalase family protein [Palleronia marisminoris]SLN69494.1 Putative ring-cleaving dioxygenase MhqO [Palleronia marisminoris]
MTAIPGLHHVTAICSSPQDNLDFYTRRLGQRLVKKTVNFDDPGTYHLYYGDRTGTPGSIMTFFPFVGAGPGRAGNGMASAVAYAADAAGVDAWMERLALDAIDFDGSEERFGARVITLTDPDGLPVEIAETADMAPGGFHSVTLRLADPKPTARLLTGIMGYEELGEETRPGFSRLRLRVPGGAKGSVIDLVRNDAAPLGRSGAGTIHHIAFRARDAEEQSGWQDRLRTAGLDVTPIIDRQYFTAIYFREPGGVLFEIATDPPGFAIDEPEHALGRKLMLPKRYEPHRAGIEDVLPLLSVPA